MYIVSGGGSLYLAHAAYLRGLTVLQKAYIVNINTVDEGVRCSRVCRVWVAADTGGVVDDILAKNKVHDRRVLVLRPPNPCGLG